MDSLIIWIGKSLDIFVKIFEQPEVMKWLGLRSNEVKTSLAEAMIGSGVRIKFIKRSSFVKIKLAKLRFIRLK